MNLLSSLLKYTADQIAALRTADSTASGNITALGNRMTTAEGDIDSLESQFTTVVSAVTTDTEVTNIRVGADGVTYTTAGEAVRNQLSDVKDVVSEITDTIYYSIADLSPDYTANGWALKGDGLCVADSSSKMLKYSVSGGDVLHLNLSKDNDGVYQWQARSDVPSSGTNYAIGTPCVQAVNGYVVVPDSATWLIVSVSNSNTTNSVKKATQDVSDLKNVVTKVNSGFGSAWGEYENIFDGYLIEGYISNTTGETVADSGYICTDYIPVEQGYYYYDIYQGYYVNGKVGFIKIALYDSDKNYIESRNYARADSETYTDETELGYRNDYFYVATDGFIRFQGNREYSDESMRCIIKSRQRLSTMGDFPAYSKNYNVNHKELRKTLEDMEDRLYLLEANCIPVESGTFLDSDGTSKYANLYRIRNTRPILVSDFYKIKVPTGYSAWVFYLDANLNKIGTSSAWISGDITKLVVGNAVYINIAFRNTSTPSADISGEIDSFQRALVLAPVSGNERLDDFRKAYYPYYMRNTGGGWTRRINLLHISDCHIGQAVSLRNYIESVSIGNELYADSALHAVVNTGDMTNGMTYTKATLLSELAQFTNAMSDSDAPYLALLGNHDANDGNNAVANVPTKSDLWTNFYSHLATSGIVWGDSGSSGYCYYNVTNGTNTIRVIMLDMLDHADYTTESVYDCQHNTVYSQDQIDWLAETALNVPSGYGVIICNHFPFAPYRDAGYSEQYPALNDGWFVQSSTNDRSDGWKMIPEIVQAWQNRTSISKTYYDTSGSQDIVASYNFSSVPSSAEFICYLVGHTHSKNAFIVEEEDGVSFHQLMLCEDSSGQNGVALNRVYKKFGSIVDNAFSVLSIDMIEKKVYRTAFGAYIKCNTVDSKQTEVFSYNLIN